MALSIPNTVKEIGVGARPINKYEMISMNRDAWARPRSNAGEWISFLTGGLDTVLLPESEDSSGRVSVGLEGNSTMSGLGLNTLMMTDKRTRSMIGKERAFESNLVVGRSKRQLGQRQQDWANSQSEGREISRAGKMLLRLPTVSELHPNAEAAYWNLNEYDPYTASSNRQLSFI
jgi:hypothetical protein